MTKESTTVLRKNPLKLPNSPKLEKKLQDLKAAIKKAPFWQTKDKIAFICGVILLIVTEYFLLQKPSEFYKLYTVVIFPLLIIRFFTFHKAKMHYFMLDFCYYCQVIALFQIYVLPQNPTFAKLSFCLLNGPLPFAIVAWRLSLVFHDLSKLTSLLIHIYPSLVCYTLRWHNVEGFVQDWSPISLKESILLPLGYYLFWQTFYVLKTELFDKKKLQDPKFLTSAKWLSQKQPHVIYRYLTSKGVNLSPVKMLIIFQLLYTAASSFLAGLMYEYHWFHALSLAGFIGCGLWNGANFYFESFAKSYTKMVEAEQNKEKDAEHEKEKSRYTPSFKSVCSFFIFFSLFMVCLSGLAYVTVF